MNEKQITAVYEAAGYVEKAIQMLEGAGCNKESGYNKEGLDCDLCKGKIIRCPLYDLSDASHNLAEIQDAIDKGEL